MNLSRASMRGFGLRSQPSRPPPPFDPAVEAWLDSLPPPAARPSVKELRQWNLRNYHGLGRGVFITCLLLRAVSWAISLAVTGVIASVVARRHGPLAALDRLVPVLVVCPVVAVWNTAEFVTACLCQDGGIRPNVHVLVDGALFLGVATVTGILLVDVICGITDNGPVFDTAAEEMSSACLLIVTMVIHSFLLFFFVCSYLESNRKRSRQGAGRWPAGRAGQRLETRPSTGDGEPSSHPEIQKVGQSPTDLRLSESDQKRGHSGISTPPRAA